MTLAICLVDGCTESIFEGIKDNEAYLPEHVVNMDLDHKASWPFVFPNRLISAAFDYLRIPLSS